jgi:hypothetical protein
VGWKGVEVWRGAEGQEAVQGVTAPHGSRTWARGRPITVFKDSEFNVKDSLKACSLEALPQGWKNPSFSHIQIDLITSEYQVAHRPGRASFSWRLGA